MRVRLPGLGASFRVEPLNAGNEYRTQAANGQFPIVPGVYLLIVARKTTPRSLPEKIGRVGLREFVCPAVKQAPPTVLVMPQEDVSDRATIVAPQTPLVLFDADRDSG